MKKLAIKTAISAVLVFVLAGCGGDKTETAASNSGGAPIPAPAAMTDKSLTSNAAK